MEDALVRSLCNITKPLYYSASVLLGEKKPPHTDAATHLPVTHAEVHWKPLAALNLIWVGKTALVDVI